MGIKRLKMPRFSSLFRRRSKKISETNQSINLVEDRKPRRKISLKFPSIKSPSMPTIPLFGFLKTVFKITGQATKYTLSTVLVVAGTLGLTVSYINPMQFIASYLPFQIEGTIISVDQALVQSWLIYLNTNLIETVAISSTLLLIGILVHVRNFKAWWLNLRKTPMGIVRSPIRAYKRITIWRNWILAKVNYLNEESAKWKTTFKIMASPYSLLRACGFSPQMAATFLFAGTAVTSGVVVNETILSEASFSRGDPGVYNAPLDTPVFAAAEFNTLRLDLGATSVGLVEIDSISLGTAYTGSALPSGETNVVIIGGLPTVVDPAFTETFLEVGTMYVDRWRCETLAITNSEIHNLIIRGNASDGQSISAVAGTPRDRGINGGNRADDMITSGGYYDQLKITSASSGINGKVDILRLTNIYSKGGGCVIDRVKAGTMEVTLNEIGGDSNLSTKAFTVATTVIYKSFTNTSNVEVAMAVPAAQ